jgi:energy-coupling factor transporter ATP-binding protein EcfA2
MADVTRRIMIETSGLSKYYGPFVAIKDVTFSIPEGQIVSFLGPNGAGKSTTMKILAGYLAASAGTARIAGFDMTVERLEGARQLGYLPEKALLTGRCHRVAAFFVERASSMPAAEEPHRGRVNNVRSGGSEVSGALARIPAARRTGAGALARPGRPYNGRACPLGPQPDRDFARNQGARKTGWC